MEGGSSLSFDSSLLRLHRTLRCFSGGTTISNSRLSSTIYLEVTPNLKEAGDSFKEVVDK